MIAVSMLSQYYTFDGRKHDAVFMCRELAAVPREEERPDLALLPEVAELLATTQKLWPFAQLFCTP
jgi:hypothetical protein